MTAHAAACELELAADMLRLLAEVGRATDADAARVVAAARAYDKALEKAET